MNGTLARPGRSRRDANVLVSTARLSATESGQASDVLREAIRGSGLSLQEIGRRTNVQASVLSRFMTGRRGITFGTFEALAPVLGLRVVLESRFG